MHVVMQYISTYNTFMVSFHRTTFSPTLSLYDRKRFPQYTLWHRYINIYRYNMVFGIRQNGPLCVQAPAAVEVAVFGRRVLTHWGRGRQGCLGVGNGGAKG